jgi:hypothetical protein
MLRRVQMNVALTLALATIFYAPNAGATEGGNSNKMAGTYWITIRADTNPPQTVPGVLSLTQDGRVMAIERTSAFENSGLGTWKANGSHEMVGSFITFAYKTDGSPRSVARIDFTGEFVDDYSTAQLSYRLSIYLSTANPLTDTPLLSFTGIIDATRLDIH